MEYKTEVTLTVIQNLLNQNLYNYVLGTLFYRFISENFTRYIEADDDSIHYANLSDSVITDDIKDDAIKTKGYFIYPSQLFATVAASANTNESLNTDLATIFAAIESSANGYSSERDIGSSRSAVETVSFDTYYISQIRREPCYA